jgi:hypothetical protein
MKIIRRHIWGIIQFMVSVLLVIKWLSKPINIGQLGQDNIALYFLLTVIVTIISLESYLNRKAESIEELTPVFICVLTLIVIPIGNAINNEIEKNRKPVISATYKGEKIVLFKDNTFEFEHRETEYVHYDRGRYSKQANKLIFDKRIFVWNRITNTFYISDTSLYIITVNPSDTIVFKRDQK